MHLTKDAFLYFTSVITVASLGVHCKMFLLILILTLSPVSTVKLLQFYYTLGKYLLFVCAVYLHLVLLANIEYHTDAEFHQSKVEL